jgi:hypothetical protein
MRNVYKILVGKLVGNRQIGYWHTCQNNIKTDLRKSGYGNVD